MANDCEKLVYFVNSRGQVAYIVSPTNTNYWELGGRTGFSAPSFETFSEKMASGRTKYFGKAAKPRDLAMRMVCKGKDRAELDRVFYTMMDVLLDSDGQGEGKLYVKRSDGSMAFINCVYTNGAETLKQHRFIKDFTLRFYATDPFFYVVGGPYSFNDLYMDYDWTLPVINPTTMDAEVQLVLSDFGMPYDDHEWSMEGYFKNLTTEKKIQTLQYETASRDKMVMNLSADYYEIYYQNRQGKKDGSAWKGIDWDNSDFGFCLVPGENVIKFEIDYDNRLWKGSSIQFLYKVNGV